MRTTKPTQSALERHAAKSEMFHAGQHHRSAQPTFAKRDDMESATSHDRVHRDTKVVVFGELVSTTLSISSPATKCCPMRLIFIGPNVITNCLATVAKQCAYFAPRYHIDLHAGKKVEPTILPYEFVEL